MSQIIALDYRSILVFTLTALYIISFKLVDIQFYCSIDFDIKPKTFLEMTNYS